MPLSLIVVFLSTLFPLIVFASDVQFTPAVSDVVERFCKVDKERSDCGTGLGLAIVKHIINAHDGEVNVSSVQGEGSSFTIVLPTE